MDFNSTFLIPQDKANHFVYGSLAYHVGALIGIWLGPKVGLFPSYIGLATSALVGAGKEAADGYLNWKATGDPRQGPHGFEFMDFVATVSGGISNFLATVTA